LNSKIVKKFISISELDRNNEHHLYLTSSDDEQELPISMKVTQMQKEEEADRILKHRSWNFKILPYIS